MSKRFIDTGLFDDEWFMNLSKDGKILWIYLITKCDHAGLIKINEKLCKVQTDIKDLKATLKELSNCLHTISEGFIFIPKFLYYQYPNFPNSNFRAEKSAIEILIKNKLFDKGSLTVSKELTNSYGNGIGIGNGNGNKEGGLGETNKFNVIPPTVEAVAERMKERNITSFTAETFCAFYQSKGWKIGKEKMKNWDAALTTWNDRRDSEQVKPLDKIKYKTYDEMCQLALTNSDIWKQMLTLKLPSMPKPVWAHPNEVASHGLSQFIIKK